MGNNKEIWQDERFHNEAMAAHLRIISRFKKTDNLDKPDVSKSNFIKEIKSLINSGRP